MITGFEDITHELTPSEKEIFIPIIIRGFNGKINDRKIGKEFAITEKYMRDRIQYITKRKTSAPRMRKMLASLVFSDSFPGFVLCSSGKGYYISDKAEDIQEVIQSLQDRIHSQTAKLEAIEKQYSKIKTS